LGESLVDRVNFAKIVTVLAITFGISFGLCGATLVFSSQMRGSGSILIFIGILELIVMGISALGLLLTVIVWVIASAVGNFGKNASEPQKLFDDSKNDEEK
jgi:membrane associated rhomboid family serine protease